jgi:hypothetical protein
MNFDVGVGVGKAAVPGSLFEQAINATLASDRRRTQILHRAQ